MYLQLYFKFLWFCGLTDTVFINFKVILMYIKTTINTTNLETDFNLVSGEEKPSSDIALLRGALLNIYLVLRNIITNRFTLGFNTRFPIL